MCSRLKVTSVTFGRGVAACEPEQARATAVGGSAVIAPAVALPEPDADGSGGRGPAAQRCTSCEPRRCLDKRYERASKRLFTARLLYEITQADIADELLCLYSARVVEQDDTYTVEVPKREVQRGTVQSGEPYRVALIQPVDGASVSPTETREETAENDTQSRSGAAQPPVSEGEVREVEIENIGDKGDGITRIDGGYVVIVPETDVGERVTVRLENVRENVGFAEVVKRQHDLV